MTVAAVGHTGDAMELFRGTAPSPSFLALHRAGLTGGGQELVDFRVPCNPYFPTPAMFAVMAVRLRDILTSYPSSAETITAELADVLGLWPQTMAMGNGSTELITWIDHLLVKESLAVPIPTFGRWTDQPMETGKRVDMFQLPEMSGFALDPNAFVTFVRSRGSRAAVICNPNNPDGGLLSRRAVIGIMDALADLDLIVIDESFLEFADAEAYPSVVDEAVLRPNVIVLRGLGKNFGLHGVRFGYLVAHPALAARIRSRLPKGNLNSFAEVIVFMLKRYRQEYAESLRMIGRDRQLMTTQLAGLPGVTVYPSQGNFVFVKLPGGTDGSWVRDQLLSQHGVLVRECGNKLGSSSQFMRLAVRSQPDVQRLLTGLSTVLYGTSFYAPRLGWEQQPSLDAGPSGHAGYSDYAGYPGYADGASASGYGVSASAQRQPLDLPYQQPPAELAPAYVAMPPAQPPLYQVPAALPQPPMVQLQAAAEQGEAAGYGRVRPEETTIEQFPVQGRQPDAGVPEPSPMERTQTMTYDPAEPKAAVPDPAPPAERAGDPTGQAPALRRYPRPAAYLQDDSMA